MWGVIWELGQTSGVPEEISEIYLKKPKSPKSERGIRTRRRKKDAEDSMLVGSSMLEK